MAETATTTEDVKDATSTTATETPTTQTQSTDADQLGEAGKKALAAERKRADDAEKLARKLQADADASAAAKAKQDEADAVAKGEFEKLANDRAETIKAKDSELVAITQERDALKERIATFENAVVADMTKWVADHKEQIPAALMQLTPGEGASLEDRQKWLNAAKAYMADNANGATGLPKTRIPAGGRDPKRDEEARAAQSRLARQRF